jgi:hypothetical protein
MAQKPTTTVRSAGSQRDNRWVSTVYDQHKSSRFPRGRPWWGWLEYSAERQNDPGFVAELTPGDHNDPNGSAWTAPWVPNQMANANGRSTYRLNTKRDQITWLYQTIVADDTAAMQAYYDAAAKVAYTKGWDAIGFGQPVTFQIHSILGDAPRSPKIAEAALAGDPWLLGMTDTVNETLAELLKGNRPHDLTTRVVNTVTPAQVLDPTADINALIANAVQAALAAERARTQAKQDKMATVRAARGQHTPEVVGA